MLGCREKLNPSAISYGDQSCHSTNFAAMPNRFLMVLTAPGGGVIFSEPLS
jgi:hypothetical protein